MYILSSGIPDNPALANTYYSQFEDDFTPSDDEEDEAAETVVPRRRMDDGDDDDDILFGSGSRTLNGDEDDEFYHQLKYVMDKDNDTGIHLVCLFIQLFAICHFSSLMLKGKIFHKTNNINYMF